MVTKTEFITGEKLRDSTDTNGTKYDTIVDDTQTGTIPSETVSSYFSEQALDPYETTNAKD